MAVPRAAGLDGFRRSAAASSADEAIAQTLDRARELAGLGAFISLAEQVRVDGAGPLAGIPVAVKDNLDTCDLPTTGGTPALRNSRPGRDHRAVARLRAAGAVIVGKTNMHELALGVTSNNAAFGPVRNPHDPSRSAGGSSGGSAAAVAAGIVPIALGSDTGGSVRVPAAHCGLVGWRPTVGRWGTGRSVPISSTRDTAGLLATRVADVELVDELITGRRARTQSERRLRLGVPRHGFYDDLHPDVAATVARALDRLADADVELVEVRMGDAHELADQCGFPIVFFEIVRGLHAYLASLPGNERRLSFTDVLDQVRSVDVRAALELAADHPVIEDVYVQQLCVRGRLRATYTAAMRLGGAGRLDALVYPTVPLPAPPLGDDETTELNGRHVPVFPTTIRNTDPGSIAGMPSISLPAGRTAAGLPIGVSLEALPGEDGKLLETARRVEGVLTAAESR